MWRERRQVPRRPEIWRMKRAPFKMRRGNPGVSPASFQAEGSTHVEKGRKGEVSSKGEKLKRGKQHGGKRREKGLAPHLGDTKKKWFVPPPPKELHPLSRVGELFKRV